MPGIKRHFEEEEEEEITLRVAGNGDGLYPVRKRRAQASEQTVRLAKLYNDLADEVHDVRVKAAKELIQHVWTALNEHDSGAIDKVLGRLIQGLCSNRKAARIGFSMALTETTSIVYQQHSTASEYTVRSLLDRTVALTQVQGNVSGQERRDHHLGRLYAFQAIMRSRTASGKVTDSNGWDHFLNLVFDLALEKQWLRRECGSMLYDFLTLSGKPDLESEQVEQLIAAMVSRGLAKTPEGVALWIAVSKQSPGVKLPKGIWHHDDPLHSKERSVLARTLQDHISDDSETAAAKTMKSGSPRTAPSFAWKVTLDALCETQPESALSKFWKDAVDEGLFASSVSTERKSLGLQVVSLAIARVPSIHLATVISSNVLRCIINQRADPERYLYEAAKGTLNTMVSRASSQPETIPMLVEALVGDKGAANFDHATKTKTVDSLIAHADVKGLKVMIQKLHNLIVRPSTNEQGKGEFKRQCYADLLLRIVRSRRTLERGESLERRIALLEDCLDLFTTTGYATFTPSKHAKEELKPEPPISAASQEMFRSRLKSCLSHILSAKIDPAMHCPVYVAKQLHNMESSRSYKLLFQHNDAIRNILDRTMSRLEKLSKQIERLGPLGSKALLAFKLLFAMSLIQVYDNEPGAVAVLEDLETCYESWQQTDESFIMLIELLLSFASKPSTLFRKLAEQVFAAFTSDMTTDGLQSMTDILQQKESLSGQQELFHQSDEDVDGDEDDDNAVDVGDASNVEIVNGEIVGANDNIDESDSAGEDAEDNGEDEEDEDEEAAFDAKLAEALGDAQPDSDSDGSEMDDNEMFAREEMLINVFRERKKTTSNKQDSKEAKENIVNFKNQVLNLLLIYVKHQYGSILALDLILPLIGLVRMTTSKQLAEKAFSVLKQYFEGCNKHKSLPQPQNTDSMFEILRSIHEDMDRDGSRLHANVCSRSGLFIARVLCNIDAANYGRICQMYADLQCKWYQDSESKLQPSIFTEWTSWSIATRKAK